MTTNPFVNADFRKDEASGTLALACVLRRLGPPPAGSAYRLSAGVVGRAASLDLKPLQEESFEWKEGAPAAALGAALRWEWTERASAGDTRVILQTHPAASRGAALAASGVETVVPAAHDTDLPYLKGAPDAKKKVEPPKKKEACMFRTLP